jgi:hypothetical protein
MGDCRGHSPQCVACSPKTSSNALTDLAAAVSCIKCLYNFSSLGSHRRRVTESVSHNVKNLLFHENMAPLSSVQAVLSANPH